MSDLMTTKEIICDLRDQADVFGPSTVYHLLHVAADRLEEYERLLRKEGKNEDHEHPQHV